MAAKMKSNLDAVANLFQSRNDQWISSKAVHELMPALQRQDVYASVSELARSGVLEKRKLVNAAGFEYKIVPEGSRSAKHTEVRREQRAKMLSPKEGALTDEGTPGGGDVDAPTVAGPDQSIAAQEGSSAAASDIAVEANESEDADAAGQLSLLEDADDVAVTMVPEGVRGRAPRVVWTHEEKLSIAKEVLRLQKSQVHLSVMSAVRMAQDILPEKRRRLAQIQNRHHIPWIDEYLAQARAEEATQSAHVTNEPIEEDAKPAGLAAATPSESVSIGQQLGDFAQQAALLAQHPEFATTTQLLDILMQRIGQNFKAMLLDVLSSDEMREILLGVRSPTAAEQSAAAVLTPARPEVPSAHAQSFSPGMPTPLSSLQAQDVVSQPAVTRQRAPDTAKESKLAAPRLKRVLIMGLIPSQIQEVANEFKGALDLRFWRTDQSANLLKALSKQVDQTVIMTDFIAHSHEGMIKNAEVPYVRQPGGITRLKDTLTHIYANDDL